ncbi:extracellular solute-binding protein [Chitinibacteraceae bacterium HSL-7]
MQKWMLAPLAALTLSAFAQAESVTLYSARNEQLIKPLLDQFTKETGIEVKLLSDKEGPLMERLKAEGKNTPADVLMTVDAGNLWQAAEADLLRPTTSKVLEANVPNYLRDPQGRWFGLSERVRTMFYNPSLVKASELSTYQALANPAFKGKLCLRTSKKVYNQSLVAMLIVKDGEARTEQTVKGWVNNLAAPVFADDTKLLQAIDAGQCAVGIANSYYFGRLVEKNPNMNVKVFWANQHAGGVHVNVSGAGVTKFAKNPKGAVKLIEWLSSPAAQSMYVNKDFEYPVNPTVKAEGVVASWGEFKPSLINVSRAGELAGTATQLMDRAGYK